MEITFTQLQSFSLELKPADRRELADLLDITERKLRKLVDDEVLMDEHYDEVIEWVTRRIDDAQITEHEDIEIDQVTW